MNINIEKTINANDLNLLSHQFDIYINNELKILNKKTDISCLGYLDIRSKWY
jgi:hypothetical protein